MIDLPLGEGTVGGDGDLALLPSDGDGVTEGTSLSADLDPLLEELLEGGDVHDLVVHRLCTVDRERRPLFLPLRSAARRRAPASGHLRRPTMPYPNT